jgi:hypothetical protein
MHKDDNKLTVKTTGDFELRDPIQNVDIGNEPVEVDETSFISQMLGLKRLEKVGGKTTQEYKPDESNHNPSVGEALPVKDSEPTISELQEKRGRGRPSTK